MKTHQTIDPTGVFAPVKAQGRSALRDLAALMAIAWAIGCAAGLAAYGLHLLGAL